MLHWSAGWRRLLDLPKLSPILHELFGGAPGSGCEPDPEPPNFRMDHMYLQRLRKGFPGGRLHGGPRLNDQPGWYLLRGTLMSTWGFWPAIFDRFGPFFRVLVPVSWILAARRRERRKHGGKRSKNGREMA